MPDPPELAGAVIVLVGSFNPAIFQPAWFARQNLISQADSDTANVQVIHPQISAFDTEAFAVQVTPERFMASSKPNAHVALLRDLVLGAFYMLEHTPVTAMGINRHMHFRLASESEWHQFGDRLAPKDAWNTILGGRPGLATLEILAARPDADGVPFRIKVQTSNKIGPFGVYFETNEHYAADESGLRGLLETLRERFDDAQQSAEHYAHHVIDWTRQSKA